MELVLVAAGRFVMGSDDGPEDERPSRQVWLDAFYIGVTEVTNAEFEEFRPGHEGARDKHSAGDDSPAVNVTWDDAVAFCAWLTERDGVTYRLPTEAEWERAALGDGESIYPWGDDAPLSRKPALANYLAGPRRAWRRDGFMYAAPVGSLPDGASPFGALDMAGNVAEWCADLYGATSYEDSPDEAPVGPEEGDQRVVRGGSWRTPLKGLRSTRRDRMAPDASSPTVGFRVARELFPD